MFVLNKITATYSLVHQLNRTSQQCFQLIGLQKMNTEQRYLPHTSFLFEAGRFASTNRAQVRASPRCDCGWTFLPKINSTRSHKDDRQAADVIMFPVTDTVGNLWSCMGRFGQFWDNLLVAEASKTSSSRYSLSSQWRTSDCLWWPPSVTLNWRQIWDQRQCTHVTYLWLFYGRIRLFTSNKQTLILTSKRRDLNLDWHITNNGRQRGRGWHKPLAQRAKRMREKERI